jgi:hypothetical protein
MVSPATKLRATMLTISNDGQEIIASNYWQSEYARRGHIYLSVNAGAFRLLLPPFLEEAIRDMGAGREVVVSRGPWPDQKRADAIEVIFEDGSDSPFVLHFGIEQIDRLPAKADEGRRDLRCTVWTSGAVKRLSLPAAYRRVKAIPCLDPL